MTAEMSSLSSLSSLSSSQQSAVAIGSLQVVALQSGRCDLICRCRSIDRDVLVRLLSVCRVIRAGSHFLLATSKILA